VEDVFAPAHHVAVCTIAAPVFGAKIDIHFVSELIASLEGLFCNFVRSEDIVLGQREVGGNLQQLIPRLETIAGKAHC